MNEIVIVGGGFAGVWAAASAARLRREAGVVAAQLPIVLVAPTEDMVIRPRLYEASPGDIRVALRRILDPIEVTLRPAVALDVDTRAGTLVTLTGRGKRRVEPYARLVLATGSRLSLPRLPGVEYLHDVDTLPAATALEKHLQRLQTRASGPDRFTAVVVGAGFTGLEVATELVTRLRDLATPVGAADQVRVIMVERADVVGPELGEGPRAVIEGALNDLGIELKLGTTLSSAHHRQVLLSDGSALPASTVIWTGGMAASPLTHAIPGARDEAGRLRVGRTLAVPGVNGVFAAGDVAAAEVEDGELSLQSCQHAHAMGKLVGHNAVASVLGLPLDVFDPDPYVTCLDLGAAGAVYTTGWDRAVVHIGQAAKDLKGVINRAIYPPVDDAEAILRAADHRHQTAVPGSFGSAACSITVPAGPPRAPWHADPRRPRAAGSR